MLRLQYKGHVIKDFKREEAMTKKIKLQQNLTSNIFYQRQKQNLTEKNWKLFIFYYLILEGY